MKITLHRMLISFLGIFALFSESFANGETREDSKGDLITFEGVPGNFVGGGCAQVVQVASSDSGDFPLVCLEMSGTSFEKLFREAQFKQLKIKVSGYLTRVQVANGHTLRKLSPVTYLEPIIATDITETDCKSYWDQNIFAERMRTLENLIQVQIPGTNFQLSQFVPVVLVGSDDRASCSVLVSAGRVIEYFIWSEVPTSGSEFLGPVSSESDSKGIREALRKNNFKSALVLSLGPTVSIRGIYEIFHEGFHWFQRVSGWTDAGRQGEEESAHRTCYQPFVADLEVEYDSLLGAIEAHISNNQKETEIRLKNFFRSRDSRLLKSGSSLIAGGRGTTCRLHEAYKEQGEGTAEFISTMAKNSVHGRTLKEWLIEERHKFDERRRNNDLWEDAYYKLGSYQLILMNLMEPENFESIFSNIGFPIDVSQNPVEFELRRLLDRWTNRK